MRIRVAKKPARERRVRDDEECEELPTFCSRERSTWTKKLQWSSSRFERELTRALLDQGRDSNPPRQAPHLSAAPARSCADERCQGGRGRKCSFVELLDCFELVIERIRARGRREKPAKARSRRLRAKGLCVGRVTASILLTPSSSHHDRDAENDSMDDTTRHGQLAWTDSSSSGEEPFPETPGATDGVQRDSVKVAAGDLYEGKEGVQVRLVSFGKAAERGRDWGGRC